MRGTILVQIGQACPETAKKLAARLEAVSLPLRGTALPPSGRCPLEASLRRAADLPNTALVLTLGAAGPFPGHAAPEALSAVLTCPLPGMAQALRSVLPPGEAQLFRGTAGLRGGVLLANLPPPPWAEPALAAILPGVLGYLTGPTGRD